MKKKKKGGRQLHPNYTGNRILPTASIKNRSGKIDSILFNWLLEKLPYLSLHYKFLIYIVFILPDFQFTSHNSISFSKLKIKTSQDTSTVETNHLQKDRHFSKWEISLSANLLIEVAIMYRLYIDFFSSDAHHSN